MSATVVAILKVVPGSEGAPITVERVSFLRDEPRGLAELRRLSDEFREPERQSYTSTWASPMFRRGWVSGQPS